ncbi:hypothetical protein QWC_27072 [Achromobacter marplatensis]|jgi:hypothetical protein|nr:hypothetical protein QWC_27072 [Achromobacter marplatensis]
MQGSFLILFASEPPRGTCQVGQAALARHLLMTPNQDREEVCNKVLPRRFKAQRENPYSAPMKNAPCRARRVYQDMHTPLART